MCGIAGVVDPAGALGVEAVRTMNERQRHRGPDHRVVVDAGPFVLGNTRLAVQDPSPAGNQPFRHPDGSVVAVFNGEIYNFRSVAREAGLDLRTGCDGEIVPLLWHRMGPACLELFRGMFALAVADLRVGRLYLARDPFGIKPLHWRRVGPAVAFSSEVVPLEELGEPPSLDRSAIAGFLRFGSVPLDRTPWESVRSVGPGECLSIGAEGDVRPESTVRALSPTPVAEGRPTEIASAVLGAVGACLHADVPTTLLLSAGIDSSIIAAGARRLGVSLHCLTVGGIADEVTDEAPIARQTARHYQHDHEIVRATIDDESVDRFLRSMQRPSVDGLNTFVVCQAVAAAGFKVAVSGLGADEAVGGYRAARLLPALRALRAFDRVPGALTAPVVRLIEDRVGDAGKTRRLLAPTGPRDAAGLVRLSRELFAPSVVRALIGDQSVERSRADRSCAEPARGTPLSPLDYRAMAAAELDLYLQPTLLPDADAFSMASSIELRVPFVDREFFATMLDRSRPIGKRAVVAALGDPYLDALTRRRKTGFALPMGRWMRSGPLRRVVDRARRPDAPIWDVIDRGAGVPILESVEHHDRWSEAWALAVLDGWLRFR
jgi:asparagine synthase (glutamine-hydrolysing)